MRPPILRLHTDELIVDSFAGGGGASTGIEWALGRSPDIAINHDHEAIAMHAANHPSTRHFCESVWDVSPRKVTAGRPVGLAWFSPDCKHFSKAKGGKPVDKAIRGLAWVVHRWARDVRPRVICLENVEEFQTWGPLLPDGTPCPAQKGITFRRWVSELRGLGYRVEWNELRACDYGAPTTRKRLFVAARCDDQPIVWPDPTHGPGRIPYRAAAEIIDWSIPARSIFNREKPLAEATMRRIAAGLRRYVLEAKEPFIVPAGHRLGGGKHAQAAAFLAKHYTGVVGSQLALPIDTITAVDHHSLVAAHLAPVASEQVRAFLIKYYGAEHQDPQLALPLHTITTRDRFGLVMVHGEPYAISDISLRMLAPRELYLGQGFPATYRIDLEVKGRPLSQTAQVRMCGNSVSPYVAAALAEVNVGRRLEVA